MKMAVGPHGKRFASGPGDSGSTPVLAWFLTVKEQKSSAEELHNKAGQVHFGIGLSEGGDDPFPSKSTGSKVDEESLIVLQVHDLAQATFHFGFFAAVEIAFENGILEVFAIALADFVNLPEAFLIPDIIGHDKGSTAHLNGSGKGCIVRFPRSGIWPTGEPGAQERGGNSLCTQIRDV